MQKCHDVGLEVALKSGRIDLHEIPEDTADRVITACGDPRSAKIRSSVSAKRAVSVTSTGKAFVPSISDSNLRSRCSFRAIMAT